MPKYRQEPAKRPRRPLIGPGGLVSWIFAIVVSSLTVLSIVCGAVFYIVHQIDQVQMAQALNAQAIRANSEGIKALNDKRQTEDGNFDKLLWIMKAMDQRRGR